MQIKGVSKLLDSPRLVCYRRNYISVELNVTISPHLLSKNLIFTCDNQRRRISHFGVGISARSSKGQIIRLIQSISGRNGPPVAPKIMEINPVPATAVDVQSVPSTTRRCSEYSTNNCRFERIQFTSATANNGKSKGPSGQQYYNLVAVLYAKLLDMHTNEPEIVGKDQQEWSIIGTMMSEDLIVRGRNPSQFKSAARNHIAPLAAPVPTAGTPFLSQCAGFW